MARKAKKKKRAAGPEFQGPDVAQWILEKHAGQLVAISNDGNDVLASAATGTELMEKLDAAQRDPSEYFILRVYPANTILVL